MNYKKLKRIAEMCDEYRWESDGSLSVWIGYNDCRELIVDILNIDGERSPKNCVALDNLYIPSFDEILSYFINEEDIEAMFPKKTN